MSSSPSKSSSSSSSSSKSSKKRVMEAAAAAAPSPSVRSLEEQLQHELVLFFKELDDIADEEKQGFIKARSANPILLQTESPPERFLMCESATSSKNNKEKTSGDSSTIQLLYTFDAKQAARRFVDYWEKRYKIFGEEDAFKPMLARSNDADDADDDNNKSKSGALKVPYDLEHILTNGFMTILPPDAHGRPVLCVDMTIATPLHQNLCPHIKMKCLFYLLQVLSENEASQQQGMDNNSTAGAGAGAGGGIVGITIFDKTNYDARVMALGLEYESLGKAVPVKIAALHIICPLDKNQEKEFFTEALPVALCARGNAVIPPEGTTNSNNNTNPAGVAAATASATAVAQVHESVDLSTIMSRLQAVGLEPRSVPVAAGGTCLPRDVAAWFAHRQELEVQKLQQHETRVTDAAYRANIFQRFATTYSPPKEDKKRRNNNKDTRNRRIRIKAKTDANDLCQLYLWRDKERECNEKQRLRRENEMLRSQMMLLANNYNNNNSSSGGGGGARSGNNSSTATAQTLLMFAQNSASSSPTQQQQRQQQQPPLLQTSASDTSDVSMGDSSRSLDATTAAAAAAAATSEAAAARADAAALIRRGQQQQQLEQVVVHHRQTLMVQDAVAEPAGEAARLENSNNKRRRKGILVSQFISMALFLIVGVSTIALLAFRSDPETTDKNESTTTSRISGVSSRIMSSLVSEEEQQLTRLEQIQLSTPLTIDHFRTGHGVGQSTVESVMKSGKLRCGVQDFSLAYHSDPETCQKKSMEIDLCSAVAAAVLGDAQKYELVHLLIDERFIALHNRTVDLYLRAAPTMERDVFEKTTRAGFAFSVPYGYGTVRMGGHSRFVDCADDRSTRGECSNLQICVIKGSLHVQMVGLPKPYIVELELDDMLPGLLDGRCNVAVGHTPDLEKALLLVPGRFVVKVGKRVLSTEPLAIVTRDEDPQWSDLVNWVLLSLMYADEHGIAKQSFSDYFPFTTSVGRRFEHMFQDAIGSVGSFLEIRSRYSHREHNHTPRDALHFINQHELSGALLSPDFGNLDRTGLDPVSDGYMAKILYRGHFICGITGQRAGFAVLNASTGGWNGLDVDFCRAVSASLFHGNPDYYMEIVHFDSDSPLAFEALADGRVDVLAGMRMNFARDVFEPTCGQGFSFSLPYYYDNERLGETRALASRQDDSQWSAFVYWTVAALIKAEEKDITLTKSYKMPVVNLYGSNFTSMLRDAIMYVGNYGEIYSRNLETFIPRRGLNMLNIEKIGQQLRHAVVTAIGD